MLKSRRRVILVIVLLCIVVSVPFRHELARYAKQSDMAVSLRKTRLYVAYRALRDSSHSDVLLSEREYLAILQSNAPLEDKSYALRMLARVGTTNAVIRLCRLLEDEQLSNMARYALEAIPHPAVDKGLRDSLGRLTGRPLVGVIASIGVRRDVLAVNALAKLLQAADAGTAQAAARALGEIGTPSAAKVLLGVLDNVPPSNHVAFCDCLFRCAEAMTLTGQRIEAIDIYDHLRSLQSPYQVRVGALRGAIVNRGNEGLPVLLQSIEDRDYVIASAAFRISLEMPGVYVTQALADALPKLDTDKQILLVQVLGDRGDDTAVPAVLAIAKNGPAKVRVTAIKALGQIGNDSVVTPLAEMTASTNSEVSSAAKSSLASLASTLVDIAVAEMLNQADGSTRCIAIELIGQRRMISEIPALLKGAKDADQLVCVMSLKVLGDLAGTAELPVLLDILTRSKATQAAEDALAAVCVRETESAACLDTILPWFSQAQGPPKLALLRILSSVGGPNALAAVRTAAGDSNPEIQDLALRTLCDWPSVDALPDVARLAKTATDHKLKISALRGYIRLISLQDVSPEKKLEGLRESLALAERSEEKRLALAGLGNIATVDSLALVAGFLKIPDLKAEAGVAALGIAEEMFRNGHLAPAEIAAALKQLSTANDKLAKRAQALLDQAKLAAKGK